MADHYSSCIVWTCVVKMLDDNNGRQSQRQCRANSAALQRGRGCTCRVGALPQMCVRAVDFTAQLTFANDGHRHFLSRLQRHTADELHAFTPTTVLHAHALHAHPPPTLPAVCGAAYLVSTSLRTTTPITRRHPPARHATPEIREHRHSHQNSRRARRWRNSGRTVPAHKLRPLWPGGPPMDRRPTTPI